jgi:crotonobetainyl-CoA:carnitine CoA-transferase CaiB-like acyl-CoA transferase
VAALQDGGVPAVPVQGPDDPRGDPHLRARAALVSLHDPEVGAVLHVRNPLRFDGMTPAAVRRR